MSEEISDDTDDREKIVYESKLSTCKLEKSKLDLRILPGKTVFVPTRLQKSCARVAPL